MGLVVGVGCVSLFRFGYLCRRRALVLVLILTLASTLFSVTAYSFLGFYDGFSSYVGEQNDVVAVYSTSGSTPYTGVVPLSVVDLVEDQVGVVVLSPEVIAPCTVGSQSVFVRGVIPSVVAELGVPVVVEGEFLDLSDMGLCVVGSNLASRLGLEVGDFVLVFGVMSQRYVELQVKGVVSFGSALDDEVLVPLYVGQWLRGIGYNFGTLVRVKIDPEQTCAEQLFECIRNQTVSSVPGASVTPGPSKDSQAKRQLEVLVPLVQANIDVGSIDLAESQEFMQSYLGRFGVSKDVLIVLSLAVLVFASGTAVSAVNLFVRQHSSDFETLRCIGVSHRKLRFDLFVRLVVLALVATVLGTLFSGVFILVFQKLGYLLVLSHTVGFGVEPLVVVANFGLLSVLIGVAVWRVGWR